MKIPAIISILLIALSCEKSGSVESNHIYVSGEGYGAQVGPKYWLDGQDVSLPNDSIRSALTTCIAVSGNDVYVGGTYNGHAACWKNGQLITVADNSRPSYASSIAVSQNDVYLAGAYGEQAAYWKNGQVVPLGDTIPRAFAYSIAISGNDVYVAGNVGNYAVYWKNGQRINLTDGTNGSWAMGIAVSGNNVHVVGIEPGNGFYITTYWINDQPVDLHLNSNRYLQGNYPVYIAVSGNDVYIVGTLSPGANVQGTFGKSVIMFWKNDEPVQLTDGRTSVIVTGMSVLRKDVYISGYEMTNDGRYLAKYWHNGNAVNLSISGKYEIATGIVVSP